MADIADDTDFHPVIHCLPRFLLGITAGLGTAFTVLFAILLWSRILVW